MTLASVAASCLAVRAPSHDFVGYNKDAALVAPFYDPNPTGLMAETECPKVQLKGALFNHISKTGGTSFKQLLLTTLVSSSNSSARHVAFGDPETALRQKLAGAPQLVSMSEIVGSKTGSLCHKCTPPGVLSDAMAEHYFVFGLVRRPCDFMLSAWNQVDSKLNGAPLPTHERLPHHTPRHATPRHAHAHAHAHATPMPTPRHIPHTVCAPWPLSPVPQSRPRPT